MQVALQWDAHVARQVFIVPQHVGNVEGYVQIWQLYLMGQICLLMNTLQNIDKLV